MKKLWIPLSTMLVLVLMIGSPACGGEQTASLPTSTATSTPTTMPGNATGGASTIITPTSTPTSTPITVPNGGTSISMPTPSIVTDIEAAQVEYLYEDWETSPMKEYVAFYGNVIEQQSTSISQMGMWGRWYTQDTASEMISMQGGTELSPMRAQIIEGHHLRLLSQHDEALNQKYGYVENLSVAWNVWSDDWAPIEGIVLTENSVISFEANGEYSYEGEGPYYSMKFRIFAYKPDSEAGEYSTELPEMSYHLFYPQGFEGESGVYNFFPESVNRVFSINPVKDINQKYNKEYKSLLLYGIAFKIGDPGYLDVDNIRIDNISIIGGVDTPGDYTIKVTGSPGVKFSGQYYYYTTAYPHNAELPTFKEVEGTVPAEYSFRGADVSCSLWIPSRQGTLKIQLIKNGNIVCQKESLDPYLAVGCSH